MKLKNNRNVSINESDEQFIRRMSNTLYERVINLKGFEYLKSSFGGNLVRIYPATSNKKLISSIEFIHQQGRMKKDISSLSFMSPIDFANILVFNASMFAENQKTYEVKHFDNAKPFVESFKKELLPHNY